MFHERRRGSGAPRAHRSSSSGCTGTARAARHGHAGTRPRTRSAVVRRQTLSHCRRPSRCRTPSHCRTPGEVSTTRGRGPGEARYRRHASWGSSPFLPGRCIDPDGGRITGQPAYGGSEVVTQRGHRGTTSCGADDDQVGRRRQEAIFLETPSCRRRRLRTTADPTVRGSANATAGRSVEPNGVATTVSGPLRARMPSARKRRKASRPLTRSIKQRACDGPCGAGP